MNVRTAVQPFFKRVKNDGIFVAVKLLIALHRLLPRSIGLRIFESIGLLAFCLPTSERTRTIDQLTGVFGGKWHSRKIRSCARSVYGDLGRSAYDALFFSRLNKTQLERYVRFDDLTEFKLAHERGRGVMVVTAHCGCFEMLLHFFAAEGFPSFAIGSKLYDKRLDDLVSQLRSGENIEYLHRSENPRAMLRLLKAGKAMGVLIDQDTNVDGIFAHFLGKLAYTPCGAIKLAQRYDIPVFAVTTVRESALMHRVFISPEIDLHATGREIEDYVRGIEMINGHISATIEQYPTQWVWMHERWSRRPEDQAYRAIPNIEHYETDMKIETTPS
jgi:Kdo2-lipid IVA lauroyltransferase/acyltransferase